MQYPFLAIGFVLFVTLALNASTHLRDPAMVKGQRAKPWQAPVVYAEPETYSTDYSHTLLNKVHTTRPQLKNKTAQSPGNNEQPRREPGRPNNPSNSARVSEAAGVPGKQMAEIKANNAANKRP